MSSYDSGNLCNLCRASPIKFICIECKNFFCEFCVGRHRVTGHNVVNLPPCAECKEPAKYYCDDHSEVLCFECVHYHERCMRGSLETLNNDILLKKYNDGLGKLERSISSVLNDPNFLDKVDMRERKLESSKRRAEDDIHRVFRSLRESLDRRERELIDELDKAYSDNSIHQVKDEIIDFCRRESSFLDQIHRNPPQNFVEGLVKIQELSKRNGSLNAMSKRIPKVPRILVAQVDPSFIDRGDFSKWGKIKVKKSSDDAAEEEEEEEREREEEYGSTGTGSDFDMSISRSGSYGSVDDGNSRYISESVFNTMGRSLSYKGEIACIPGYQKYSVKFSFDTTVTLNVKVRNTGRNMWDDKWDIFQVGGSRLENFVPKKFVPRPLDVYGEFELSLYLTLRRGVNASGCYKFAIIDKETNKRMSEPLSLDITVEDCGNYRDGGRRDRRGRSAFPADKLRPKNTVDATGEYRFKEPWEIDQILSKYF